MKYLKIRWIAVLLLAVGTSFFFGFKSGDGRSFQVAKNLDIFNSIVKELDMFYVDTIDPDKTIRTGIESMLYSLDPYTQYFPEDDQSELEQMQQRIWDDYELTYAGAKGYLVEPFDMAGSDKRAGDIRREIRAMGPVNVTAMEDYRACRERYDDLAGQRDDLVKAQDDLLGIIESLQRQMEKQFLENFRLLQQYLSETFVKLFGGGKAELRLMDEKDVLGCGIEIVAQPPGKKLQMLSLLSGGERALTAIAILFAMLRLKPTPFCFLDEIEAALDDGNISTFADYLRDFSKDTQFVVVTHRKGTMERCDGLYGVAMEEKGVSKMLSVELKDVSAEAME